MRSIQILLAGSLLLLSFQNCSPQKFQNSNEVSSLGLAPVDLTCSAGSKISIPLDELELHCKNEAVYPKPWNGNGKGPANFLFPRGQNPPPAATVPDDCLSGFEVNNLVNESIAIESTNGTSRDLMLEVDFATYFAPDSVQISEKNRSGQENIIFDSCHIRTSCYGDPSGGTQRPFEETIRKFRIPLKKGTVSLRLNNSQATTPTYVRILGLCEFDLSHLPVTEPGHNFRLISGRPVSPMGEKNPDSQDQY